MTGPDAPIGPQVIKQTHLPARLNQQLVGVQYRSARSLRPAVACRALLRSQEFRQLGHIGRDPPDVVSAFSGRAGVADRLNGLTLPLQAWLPQIGYMASREDQNANARGSNYNW
jgi:hypothetical protein